MWDKPDLVIISLSFSSPLEPDEEGYNLSDGDVAATSMIWRFFFGWAQKVTLGICSLHSTQSWRLLYKKEIFVRKILVKICWATPLLAVCSSLARKSLPLRILKFHYRLESIRKPLKIILIQTSKYKLHIRLYKINDCCPNTTFIGSIVNLVLIDKIWNTLILEKMKQVISQNDFKTVRLY